MHKLLIWGLLGGLVLETPVTGQITVAAAADLNAALNQIAPESLKMPEAIPLLRQFGFCMPQEKP